MPDMAVFAKALGNGYPIGAVIGTPAAMAGMRGSFISSTSWTDGVGAAAALAVLEKMGRIDVPAHTDRIGSMVREIWRELADRHQIPITLNDSWACLAGFQFEHEQSEVLGTLFTQIMLERGFLATTQIISTLAQTEEQVRLYAAAVDETFAELKRLMTAGQLQQALKGPVAFRRFERLVN
jgi:glutamate-1-semialdehyde 2,1-aminomutase